MKTVLVFKTSVAQKKDVSTLRPMLDGLINTYGRWNFDLEDCDNILRVEARKIAPHAVVRALTGRGFLCEEL